MTILAFKSKGNKHDVVIVMEPQIPLGVTYCSKNTVCEFNRVELAFVVSVKNKLNRKRYLVDRKSGRKKNRNILTFSTLFRRRNFDAFWTPNRKCSLGILLNYLLLPVLTNEYHTTPRITTTQTTSSMEDFISLILKVSVSIHSLIPPIFSSKVESSYLDCFMCEIARAKCMKFTGSGLHYL